MQESYIYEVIKDIPLSKDGEQKIAKGTMITRTHDVYYLDGVLLDPGFQKDFDRLIRNEQRTGWKYIAPNNFITGKSQI